LAFPGFPASSSIFFRGSNSFTSIDIQSLEEKKCCYFCRIFISWTKPSDLIVTW
jgi:hypothetical protein